MTNLREGLAQHLQSQWYAARAPWFLLPLSGLFSAAAALRRLLYTHSVLASIRLPTRIVVIGNVAVGGSGKTPLVAWLAKRLSAENVKVGIVTRGYGGRNREPHRVNPGATVTDSGDEALWLARTTGVPVVAGRDRVAAARLLIEGSGPDIILSDDGLQHYRLERDLEIVAVDTERGFGNGALLPAGPLREPAKRIGWAGAVVLKGNGNPHQLPPGPPVFRMRYELADAVSLDDGETQPLAAFRATPVRALAAIADPESFFTALERAGLDVERHPLPDHAPIAEAVRTLPVDRPLLMTDKDAVKLADAPAHAWRVPLAIAFTVPEAAALLTLVRGANIL
ncbi:MAG: tetraacyldisaccharide 4'-kinase [Gammaproteobacteria bacterium]